MRLEGSADWLAFMKELIRVFQRAGKVCWLSEALTFSPAALARLAVYRSADIARVSSLKAVRNAARSASVKCDSP